MVLRKTVESKGGTGEDQECGLGAGINYTGPQEVLLEFVILVF